MVDQNAPISITPLIAYGLNRDCQIGSKKIRPNYQRSTYIKRSEETRELV